MVWCARTVSKIVGRMGCILHKITTNHIEGYGMYLVEGVQNKITGDGTTT